MSHEDTLDEETKRILAEVDSNDSKESKEQPSVKDKEKIETPKDTDSEEYDYDDRDPLKHEEMDDKEW